MECVSGFPGGIAMSIRQHAVNAQASQPIEEAPVERTDPTPGRIDCNGSVLAERHGEDIDPRLRQDWRQISAEEWRARHEEYKRRLAEIDAADDTPEEVYDAVMRSIDEERRIQGRPPAFEGYY